MQTNWDVIVVAAGQGKRMGTAESKQYLMLQDKPIIVHTLERFQQIQYISSIVLVVGADDIQRCEQWCERYSLTKVKTIVAGGTERQHSVQIGLSHVSSSYVMVHDGVRPFVSSAAIDACAKQAMQTGAAVLAVPVKDTIKQVDETGTIVATPDRKSLWAIQTPQAFRRDWLSEAHKRATEHNFIGTDDAMIVEWLGKQVVVVEGEYTNIKITTPEDLPWADHLLHYVIKRS